MSFFTDPRHLRAVIDELRRMQDEGIPPRQQTVIDRCTGPMGSKTAWKALLSLADEGIVTKTQARIPTGQLAFFYILEEWYAMDEEQRARVVDALERMATATERIADRMGPGVGMETKAVGPEETKRGGSDGIHT